MESLPLTSQTSFLTTTTLLPRFPSSNKTTTTTTRTRTLYLNQRKFNKVFASSSHSHEEQKKPKLDDEDLMDLEFGRLLGEDPKLTLAKIMGRKANPDASYLDIEKSFYKRKKGKAVEIEELPFEVEIPWAKNSPPESRPEPNDGDKNVAMEIKKPSSTPSKPGSVRKSSVPKAILRKPSLFKKDEDDEEEDVSSRLMLKPNLSLEMMGGQVKEKFSDMTLLRKPGASIGGNRDGGLKMRKKEAGYEVAKLSLLEQPHRPSSNKDLKKFVEPRDEVANLTLLKQPHRPSSNKELDKFVEPKDGVANLSLLEQPHRPSSNKELEKFEETSDEVTNLSLLEQPHRPSGKIEQEKFDEPSDEVANLSLLEQPHRPSGKIEQEKFDEPSDEVANLSLLEQRQKQNGKKEEKKFDEPSDEVANLSLLEQPHTPSGKTEQEKFEEPSDEVANLSLLEQPHTPSGIEQEKFEEPSDEVAKLSLLEQPHKPSSKIEHDKFEDPSDEVTKLNLLEQPHRPTAQKEQEQSEDPSDEVKKVILLEQPHRPSDKDEEQFGDAKVVVPNDGSEQDEQRQPEVHQEPIGLNQSSDLNTVGSKAGLSVEAAIQGKAKRLDQYVKQTSKPVEEKTASLDPGSRGNSEESGNFVDVSDIQEGEDADWTKAEKLIKNGDRDDVELMSCSAKGFVVSFGTLVGFLPYRNLLSKWKFLAFESWLRKKGLDPSLYKQNLVTVTHNDAEINNPSSDSPSHTENDSKFEDKISPDMKLEDLLRIYDQEKVNYLSLFIGQKTKAYVLLADRKLKKLIFSLKPKEKEDLTEKKRNLMARLQVGDIVKCSVQKITYFGVFVEVEGVSALIHQSEISWDATLDPSNYFKIDQVLEAKVIQINSARGRIFLSLKEVTPDPLMESLESVVGDHESFDGRLEAAQTDTEWTEVESLIKELKKIKEVQSVSKGRLFRSPGLAPTFQVYMASIFEDQYKLLARSGNKIQEVMVQTVLDKETMKSVIMTCASRVE
ncbi:uncharacterized protein LOC131603610 [Vicia villosa]|uniref:uncharacterized protein LOC131603610 n=1 Tax=Vicia villosa TaxID=3911 RepID=UPI00273B2C2A|nr:uncharacterized protein LOC131603610 [Vicia villosa]